MAPVSCRRRESTRVLGLDVGDRWIGVALSDPGEVLASPFAIVDRLAEAGGVRSILNMVQGNDVSLIIVGLPVSMNGAVGQQAEKVQEFVRELSLVTSVPIELRDERLSTLSAGRLMRESMGRRPKKRARDDAAAAAVILQGYLDQRMTEKSEREGGRGGIDG